MMGTATPPRVAVSSGGREVASSRPLRIMQDKPRRLLPQGIPSEGRAGRLRPEVPGFAGAG